MSFELNDRKVLNDLRNRCWGRGVPVQGTKVRQTGMDGGGGGWELGRRQQVYTSLSICQLGVRGRQGGDWMGGQGGEFGLCSFLGGDFKVYKGHQKGSLKGRG